MDVLPTLPAASVDVVCTDPPYGQSNEAYDKGAPDSVWRECFRVARPNAAILSFAGNPTYHRLATDIEAAGWKVRQMWAWVYRDGLITSAYPAEGFDRLAPAFDPIVFATKGKVLLNLEREGGEGWRRRPRGCNLSTRSDGNRAATEGLGRWPRTIAADDVPGFEYFAYRRAKLDAGGAGHPNQKPLALVRWLLAKVPGQVVLDPYMGSGTAAVVCQAAGRHFIGIEVNPEYHAMAQKRLADARGPLFASLG